MAIASFNRAQIRAGSLEFDTVGFKASECFEPVRLPIALRKQYRDKLVLEQRGKLLKNYGDLFIDITTDFVHLGGEQTGRSLAML